MSIKNKISTAILLLVLLFKSDFLYAREEVRDYYAYFGADVHPIGRPLHLKLGKILNGVLYTYDKYGLTNYEATYIFKGLKYKIVEEKNDEAGHVNPISIFNIKYHGEYCITFINLHSNPWSSEADYDGSVYCMRNGKIIKQEELSRHLIGVKDAGQARVALKPFL